MAKKSRLPTAPTSSAHLSSLADLLQQGGLTVGGEPTPAAPPAPPRSGALDLSGCGKLVVRRERKGHGGKTVTAVDGLGLAAAGLEAVAKAMRGAFGCGGRVEERRVVLQGDRAAQAEAWLRRRGARQVVQGN